MIADRKPPTRRSSRWPAARRRHLKANPVCAACGSQTGLEVHHIIPVHTVLGKEKELDPENLLTLCEARKGSGRDCHFLFGHSLFWRGWNPWAVADAAEFFSRVVESARLAKEV